MRHISVRVSGAAVLLFAAAATLLVAAPATADPASDFTYSLSGSSATITGYVGGNTVVDIPATITVGGAVYAVTDIGPNAFRGTTLTSPLTSVTIPDSVTTIEDNAFRGDVLTSVTIPASVTSIGTYAFYNNALTSVTIPDSLTAISNNAFRGNALTSVTLPDSVTAIGNNSFASNSLTSVTIPDSVTAIGNGAFATNALTSVIFAGSAPATFTAAGPAGSLDTGVGLTVYYYAGASGFASLWNGYTARAISAADSDLTLSPAGPVVRSTTPYTLTVTVRDDTHTPVAGVPVDFAIPAGVTGSATSCTTGTDGTCAITLGSTAAATYTITASIGADPTILTQSIAFIAPQVVTPPVVTPPPTPSPSAPATIVQADPAGSSAVSTTPALAATGLNLIDPLTLGGGLLALGLGFLAAALIRRRREIR